MLGSKNDVVKLSDFGFSALASNKMLHLGGTHPWRDLELSRLRVATFQQAALTDLYSFGILCLWIVFRNALAEMMESGADLSPLMLYNHSAKEHNSMSELVMDVVYGRWLPQQNSKDVLGGLFSRLMSFKPGFRTSRDAPDTSVDLRDITDSTGTLVRDFG